MMTTLTTTTPPYALGLGRSKTLVACATLADASALYQRATAVHEASGKRAANFPDGLVYDTTGAKPKQVAYVSWNGKVWAGRKYDPAAEPLFNPYAAAVEGGARMKRARLYTVEVDAGGPIRPF